MRFVNRGIYMIPSLVFVVKFVDLADITITITITIRITRVKSLFLSDTTS